MKHSLHEKSWQSLANRGRAEWSDSPKEYEDFKRNVDALLADAEIHPPMRCLELGCGSGTLTDALSNEGYDCWGIDISETAIRIACQRFPNLAHRFRVGDGTHLDAFQIGSFDALLDGRMLHCIVGEDRASFFRNARRVLKPGGVLLVYTMCQPLSAPVEGYCHTTKRIEIDGRPFRYIGDSQSIIEEAEAVGFTLQCSRVLPDPAAADDLVATFQSTR